jgi:hypothetical protein
MFDHLIVEYVNKPEDATANYNLAREYHRIGQTAAAISYYLRAAERTNDDNLAYDCLVLIGMCFDKQGNRNYTVKSMYNAAITLVPSRPEAYYHMARKLEWEKLYFESYTNAEIALKLTNVDSPDTTLEYPGKWGMLFQKAVSAWWRGRGMEARKIFQTLLNEHWSEIDTHHKSVIAQNIVSLGSGPESYAFRMYDKKMYPKLRYKFPGSSKIEHNYAQVYQDLFILSILNGKRNGTFLEVGGAGPGKGNNTTLLEYKFAWKGVSIEYDEKFINEYRAARPATLMLHQDALKTDYTDLLKKNFTDNVIDYLQLDIEPASNTYECLLKIPFDEYKFRIITYEHDYYADITRSFRDKSREYLRSKGYVLAVNDLSPDGVCNFEDWWVHPDLVDKDILEKMMSVTDRVTDATEYITSGTENETEVNLNTSFSVNSSFKKRAFVVDNFYSDPLAVRKFAQEQDYIEGGLGRGFIGKRTHNQFLFPGIKEAFESIMNKKITKWEDHGMNGRFQLNIAGEPIVYHCDDQDYAAMIYLTPDAPASCGTSTFRHRATKIYHKEDPNIRSAFNYKTFLDATPYEKVDQFGNMFNRLVIFDAGSIHGANEYFGTDMEDGRLWHMFFFDAK